MKRFLCTLFLFTLWSVHLCASTPPLPEAWRNWQYSRPIELDETAQSRLARVTLTMDVFGRALELLEDIRVINQDFQEVPFLQVTSAPQQNRIWIGGELEEVSFVPGEYTQMVVDCGENAASHNRITLDLEAGDYFAWVEVAISDDGETWRILRERAPIYRFPTEGMSSTTISYPDTNTRWLRLRILEGVQRFNVQGCRVAREQIVRPPYYDWPLRLVMLPADSGSNSQWEVDAGVGTIPVSAVRFETDQPEFHRPVRVSASLNGKNWREVGWGVIYRYASKSSSQEGEVQRSSLRVEFPVASGRYWRVTILNRNDAPLDGLSPTLQANAYRVYFRQEPGATYQLLYGNSRAKTPYYDLGYLISDADRESATSGKLGDEALNSGYVSPEPWTERHPEILWVVLLTTVVIIGFLALRTLRSA